MVRITKAMQAKHFETLSPYLKEFRSTACSTSLPLLPQHLASFPTTWPFPRGDLYHWTSLLNRFDAILENFCRTYKLDEGPQTRAFGCKVLVEPGQSSETPNLAELGYGSDGDRQLIESILSFSRMLLQNCGNRSLYASSSHLNNLLNTTSLSLLEITLSLGSELAQRYLAAFKRQAVSSRQPNNPQLLQNHYNIDLDRVQQLALPFTKTFVIPSDHGQSTLPTTPSAKGKEKAVFSTPTNQRSTTTTVRASDLVSMAKGGSGVSCRTSSPKSSRSDADNQSSQSETSWEEWGDVKVTYYPKSARETDLARSTSPTQFSHAAPSNHPTSPTPIRRSSNLGPHGHRSSRGSGSDESPSIAPRPSVHPTEGIQRPNFKTIEITTAELKSTGVHALLEENMAGLPQELQYELLTKLRVADALTSSLETRRQILAIRLLAITNLSYIHLEAAFTEKVMKHDIEEPRRLQLVYQLAELVHPPAEGDVPVPRKLQTIAFSTLDALAQHPSKYNDVCAALSTNVSHGVLLYVVRKAVAEMGEEPASDTLTEQDEWREALFSLLSNISVMPRAGSELITAGLMPILVEVLGLRTAVAERYHPKVLSFLDGIMYSARDAFQTLVNADGLQAISDLIVYEVTSASENVAQGRGMRPEYRSAAVDYEIPYFQQQTLKWLFKFIHHMMTTAGGYGGNFDRLLRNLIDSSQLLGSLREIISNARRFGSVVWTNAVGILNDFINNEPTSFAVIAEAGLSRALLEAVTGSPITMPSDSKNTGSQAEQPASEPAHDRSSTAEHTDDDDEDDEDDDDDDSDDEFQPAPRRPTKAMLQTPREGQLAKGIMPTSETINIIPQAFGAICLNNAGMKMFLASRALESFFEIFESPEHVKCMDTNKEVPSNLGGTFDELVRHHPPLKTAIMNAILDMVARVSYLCKTKAEKNKLGAVLRIRDSAGNTVVAGPEIKTSYSSKGKGKAVDDGGDVEMQDVDAASTDVAASESDNSSNSTSMTPYVANVATFLSIIFSNTSIRSEFCTRGGIEYVLDLADSPCLEYDFVDGSASRVLRRVIYFLAEQKPHLTIPSLTQRAQSAADALAPFANYRGSEPFFKPFVNKEAQQSADIELLANGTNFIKAFVNVHSLVGTLDECLHPASYNHRSAVSSLTHLNLGDYYARLVRTLGPLLGACFREEYSLDKAVPDSYGSSARAKNNSVFDHLFPGLITDPEVPTPAAEPSEAEPELSAQPNGTSSALAATQSPPSVGNKPAAIAKAERETPEFKNFLALRHLLKKMSRTVSPFFQILGKGLIHKRGGTDVFQKQSHVAIADALAETILRELALSEQDSSIEHIGHRIGMLHVLKDMFIDVARHSDRPTQVIALVLQSFKQRGGLDVTNHILESFASDIRPLNGSPERLDLDRAAEETIRSEMAIVGVKEILSLYSQITNGKNVTESIYTLSMLSRESRDRNRPDLSLSPDQFLVELRMAILPVVRRLWESDLVDRAPSEIAERLIDVIRTIATADSETNAVKRSDKVTPIVKSTRKPFKISSEHLSTLIDHDYDSELAQEALYRCSNNLTYSLDYCSEISQEGRRRNPIPEGDVAPSQEPNGSSRPRTVASTGTATPDDHAMASSDSFANGPAIIDSLSHQMPPPASPGDELVTSHTVDQLLSQVVPGFEARHSTAAAPSPSTSRASLSSGPQQTAQAEDSQPKQVTIDDLNEERAAIRNKLIDKCLDVINAHGGVTFEIADLITTVVNKSPDPSNLRKSVGMTLVIALMSFAGEDDLRTSGKKIAAYAHLVALLLKDKNFYAAAVGELKNYLGTLLGFVRLSPSHSADEPSPWIAHILLIVEMLLSEDSRPRKTKWSAPKDENEKIEPPVLETVEPTVSPEERVQLLEAVLDILPRIGKDEPLALAVLRILVILTRERSMAQAMGEKKNIQRLFVAAKQLAGASSARIQSPLMLILRHIIEDDETVKQIMRSDIKAFFEQNRQQRSLDVTSYLRGLAPTAIRAPELFVEITNEMVKFNRWSYNNSESTSSRSNTLALKNPFSPGSDPASKASEDVVQPTVQATEDLSIQDVKASTEEADSQMPDASKAAPPEHKLPVVENPDGVIHFLLCELLNYKDVEDKDPAPALAGTSPTAKANVSSNADVSMSETSPSPSTEGAAPKEDKSSKISSKEEFKAEDHPIYIYRCFLLQCLTELLASYNRTKIEFINFKRSAPPQAMTPSKPRSSVVNYLLTDLIPSGLDRSGSSVINRKKATTSSWADSVLVALLAKTGEQLVDKAREPSDGEDEPDLLFVRRFVLENVLKAYKEASTSNEALDSKYARMLSLAVLMGHIMNGKETIGATDTSLASRSQQQLRRIMFEKGFIGALTASIADVDLNFPGAKEAVRQILKPLKVLTHTAIHLSDMSLVSGTQGQTEDDGIESATSVSDLEDEREETPDLFRNSTLGMFEPDREEESSSESEDDDDEEMYDDGYGDEMEYEEDLAEDAEDNISEEDEDIEGIGHIEGLSGDHAMDVEVIMEEDDDDDEDDSDEDDDDHDSEDEDGHADIIDEVEDAQHLAEDDDLEEWESDDGDEEGDDEEDYERHAQDEDEIHMRQGLDATSMVDGPLGILVRALGGGEGAVDMLERMEEQMEAEGLEHDDEEDRMGGEYVEEGDGDEDEDDEEDMGDEEMFLEQGYPGGGPPAGFEWEGDVDPPLIISHRGHHHRPRHAFAPPFPMFPGARGDPLGGMSPPSHVSISVQVPPELRHLPPHEIDDFIHDVVARYMGPEGHNSNGTNPSAVPEYRSAYRSHRPPQQRSVDDGTNPLLQRHHPSNPPSARMFRDSGRPHMAGDWIHAMAPQGEPDLVDLARLGGPFGESPATAALLEVLRSLPDFPGSIARNGGAGLSFHITGGHVLEMPASLRALIGGPRGSRFDSGRGEGTEPGNAAFFAPQPTAARWAEEAKLLFGANNHEKANDLRSAIESVLVPPAIEADKAQKAAEIERLQKLEEEAKKQAEEERLAREAKEEEERIAKEKKEREEREAAELAAAEAREARGGDSMQDEAAEDGHSPTEAMDGVESEAEPAAEAEAQETPAEDRPRVTTMIRGSPFDITDLGIDAEFLAELPEEIREEVIMTAVAERRSQAAATGAQPSEIDQEFLDALPEDIRDEIIQQERQDRRRREREEQRRQAAAAGGAPTAGEMDAASILATLPPALRQQVLMEQDEEMLSLLPQELADQARAAQRDHPAHHGRIPGDLARRNAPIVRIDANLPNGSQRPQRRSIVQMLDKAGIATLLRLMFTLQPDHLKTALWSVLENICMNRQNRTEVVSTILHILQDGSADMSAVERSFAQLSLRAKQPKENQQKTPQPLKRTHTGMSTSSGITSLIQANSEASPLLVVQQCLGTLHHLVSRNLHIPAFFLTEHDTTVGLKRTLSRKGKGKENKAAKYAINSLLNLLDRDLIMENSTVMELLSGLLNQITQPLQALQRKQKEIEASNTEAAPSTTDNAGSAASPEPTEQPTEQHVENVLAEVPTNTEGGEASTTEAQQPEADAKEEKKQRPITPPVIPEHNLKLVINIFVARECSSRTFRETLSTIKNLSAIPGAKAVFGRELIAKAQGLGEIILLDLEALLPQIQKATTGTEIQGVALAKFSPAGSEQGKLLRVLTALDHLFDPKREKKEKPDEGEPSQVIEKQDLLSSLYENSTFGPMWEKLSACLTVIRQRDHMLNVATILLPLIESLMVVCKNTTLKETPISRSQIGKEMMLTSPPPESRMENLFFSFTEDHRKILNDLVRNSPKLMSGTFSLLVKNPKVLEFDNKRNYFSRSIHTKSSNTRQSYPPLQLSVRRDQVFHDSFKALYFQTADQMKFGKLNIRFHGEEGVDAGGVTREWFQVLSRQMFDPGYALFIPVSSDRTTFHPNQLSGVNEEHLMFFKFIGRIIGKALYEGRVLDCHFSRAVYKRILGKAVSVKDMESLDPDYYKSLVWMLENDITDIITETFSVDNDKFGVVETIEFIPNGRNIAITEENKHEYVRLMVEWKLTGSVKDQLDEFLKGFHDIIPAELIAIFNEQELELLISGLPEIDVDDWKSNTEYHNYSASSSQIQWFWRAVRSYDKEERAKLLQFVTGTSKVPLNGFKELEGMNGFSRFNIHRDYGSKDRLPSSHTCFNQLDLPEYDSYEVLRQQVLMAITAGSQYFGFA